MIPEQILNNLSRIIGTNKTSENVYNTFIIAKDAIQKNEVIIEINPNLNPEMNFKLENSLMGGMYFRKIKPDSLGLVFGKKYLETYTINSSIHHTMLMHELKHLYDCLTDKNIFFNSNEMERFQYELDAMNIEVEFITHYLAGNFNLSECEKYILKSYDNDNLESWTISNRSTSTETYRFLNNLGEQYKQNLVSKDELAHKLIQKADELLEKSNQFMDWLDVTNPNIGSKFPRYAHYIKLKTFKQFLIYVFNFTSEINELLEANAEFKKKNDTIDLLLCGYDQPNKYYSDGLNNYWENTFIAQ